MRVSNALTLFTHLIALTGFLAISLTGAVGVPTISIFTISLILSFINDRYGRGYYLGHGVSTLLALLLAVYLALGVFLLRLELFQSILDFLIFLQVIKLLGKKSMRDIIQIYALSFFQFLAGTIITVNFSYSLAFVIYIAVAVWAIIVFEMRKGAIDAGNRGNEEPALVTPRFLSAAFILSFCILLAAVLIFVSVPRLRGSYFSSGFLRTGELKSGFSEEVKLGRVGEIKLDGSPVMMVRILDRGVEDIPYPVYWRGVSLDKFDGETWRAGTVGHKIYAPDPAGRIIVSVAGAGGYVLKQEIITEPLDTDVLFSANVPIGFSSVPGGRVSGTNDSYSLHGSASNRIKYYAVSDILAPSPEELRKDDSPYPHDMEAYLQLPPLGERVRDLALEITSSDKSAYDKAVSIKRYLLTNYGYTRTLASGSADYPLEEFLFTKKEGHCEYFATAMAVLLREAGIPSRIVNGFIGGDVNKLGNFFLIRESDAHSWVEVFFPGHGWVSFDPTPESGGGASPALVPFVASYLDYLRFRWNRYVIDFSGRDQERLLGSVRDTWTWNARTLFRGAGFKSLLDKRAAALIAVLVIAAGALAAGPGIRSFRRSRSGGPAEKSSALYNDALRFLSKRGYPKPEFMTAREFSDVLARGSYPGSSAMESLTGKYLQTRFGGSGGEKDLKVLAELLKNLKRIKA